MPLNSPEQRKLAAIMFTDMVGYSALTQRNEKLALQLLEEHRRLLRDLFPKFNGMEIETTGDGFLVEFGSALEAAQCAIEIQRALATRSISTSPDRQIQVRIGIHVGDVVHKDGHVLGDGVNIAARLQPLAEPGGICISVDVARQVQHNLEATVIKLGERELKNIKLPMEIFRIAMPWENPKAGDVQHGASERGRKQMRPLALATVAFFILAAISWWVVSLLAPGRTQVPTRKTDASAPIANREEGKSIAVLPFVNLSQDERDEYLSDGMTEELLNVLAKVKGLRVPGRSSSFAFKGKNEEGIFRKVGEQLNVKSVLEGSVRKAGNKLRITAQLINVADGFHLWSDTYDRDITDIFAIQTEVAQQVAAALKIQLGVQETLNLARKGTENPEAYNLYLQGRFFWNKRTKQDTRKAIAYFEQALARDPKYALAYSGLADSYVLRYLEIPPHEAASKTKAAALRALELDATLAEPHTALGWVKLHYDWDWPGAEKEFKRALELNPNHVTAHQWYALYFVVMGRFNEAIAEAKRAHEIDPLSLIASSSLGRALYFARRYNQAIEQLEKTLELDPNYSVAHWALGHTYQQKGLNDKAMAEFEKGSVLDGESSNQIAALRQAYTISGWSGYHQKQLEFLQARAKKEYVPPFYFALIHAQLGEKDVAFQWLDKAREERSHALLYLNVEPRWDILKPDPRFTELLKKVGLEK